MPREYQRIRLFGVVLRRDRQHVGPRLAGDLDRLVGEYSRLRVCLTATGRRLGAAARASGARLATARTTIRASAAAVGTAAARSSGAGFPAVTGRPTRRCDGSAARDSATARGHTAAIRSAARVRLAATGRGGRRVRAVTPAAREGGAQSDRAPTKTGNPVSHR